MNELTNKYPAFYKWLLRETGGSSLVAAGVLYSTIMSNPSRDNTVWELLESTGDKAYNKDTFVRAAELAFERAREESLRRHSI